MSLFPSANCLIDLFVNSKLTAYSLKRVLAMWLSGRSWLLTWRQPSDRLVALWLTIRKQTCQAPTMERHLIMMATTKRNPPSGNFDFIDSTYLSSHTSYQVYFIVSTVIGALCRCWLTRQSRQYVWRWPDIEPKFSSFRWIELKVFFKIFVLQLNSDFTLFQLFQSSVNESQQRMLLSDKNRGDSETRERSLQREVTELRFQLSELTRDKQMQKEGVQQAERSNKMMQHDLEEKEKTIRQLRDDVRPHLLYLD